MLGSGDRPQFRAVLQAARLSIMGSISAVSTETASHINPAMVRLQMLEALSEAWILNPGGDGGGRADSAVAASGGPADQAVVERLQRLWHSREQAAGRPQSRSCQQFS